MTEGTDIKSIWKKARLKASLTVEASILIPFILFTIAGGIQLGYKMFQEAKEATEIQEELVKLDPVEIVRRNTWIQGLKED